MLVLAAATFLALQDGEVDRILAQFQRRREQVRTIEEFRRLLADSRTELEAFLKANPRHKDAPRAAFQIAETYLSSEDFDHALEKVDAYLRDYPDGPDVASARFARGQLHLEKERDAEARAAFEGFAKQHPQDERVVFARMFAAISLQNEGKYDEAAARLIAVRRDFGQSKDSWSAAMQLAVLYHVAGLNPQAKGVLEEIIRDCPDKDRVAIARRHLQTYLRVGKEAPAFAEKDMEGRDFSSEKLLGKVVVVYFFDPVAPPSIPEGFFIRRAREEAAQAGKADDLQVLGVSIGQDRKEMPLYRARVRSDWPLFWDPKGLGAKLPLLFDVIGLPSITVIDRQGKIRFYNVANRDFRNVVSKLLEEK